MDNLLNLNDLKMINIKYNIIVDRGYNVPDRFLQYISDDLLVTLITGLEEPNDELTDLVSRKIPTVKNIDYIITQIVQLDRVDMLDIFDAHQLYITGKRYDIYFTESVILELLSCYIHHKKTVPKNIIKLYIHNVIHPLWLSKRYDHMLDIFSDLITKLEPHCIDVVGWRGYIIPTFYKFVPSKKIEQYKNAEFGRTTLYINGFGIVEDDATVADIINYLSFYIATNRHSVLPEWFTDVVITDLRRNFITYNRTDSTSNYLTLLSKTIVQNPDNIKLVYDIVKYLETNSIFGVELPDMEFIIKNALHSKYTLTKIDEYIDLCESNNISPNYDVLLRHTDDLAECIYHVDVLRYLHDFISTAPENMIHKFMNLDYVIETSNERINEYMIREYYHTLGLQARQKIMNVVLTNEKIYSSLSADVINILLANKDILEMIKEYPLILKYRYSLDANMTISFLEASPSAIQYVPYNRIPTTTLCKIISSIGYIPINVTEMSLTTETVWELLQHGVGYGYILDLPTTLQINTIIKYVYNMID